MDHILQFFAFTHLPPAMQAASKPFAALADHIAALPENPERTVALRKLLEAKDAAVRAALLAPPKADAADTEDAAIRKAVAAYLVMAEDGRFRDRPPHNAPALIAKVAMSKLPFDVVDVEAFTARCGKILMGELMGSA